jgi:hypothetical protein
MPDVGKDLLKIKNDRKFLLRASHRELKIAPPARCQPALKSL